MSKTLTIRLTPELAGWLDEVSSSAGVPRGKIVRDQLEKARKGDARKGYMRLAGSVRLAADLSARKGFTK